MHHHMTFEWACCRDGDDDLKIAVDPTGVSAEILCPTPSEYPQCGECMKCTCCESSSLLSKKKQTLRIYLACVFAGSFNLCNIIARKAYDKVWFEPDFVGFSIAYTQSEQNKMPTFFTKFNNMNISRKFYQVASNVEETQKRVWHIQTSISYMGTTSYVLNSVLRESKEGPVLASFDGFHVRVNANTRKPDPIPDSVLEKKCHIRKPKKVRVLEKFMQPAGVSVFSRMFRIRKEYTDVNGHTAVPFYMALLMECLEEACCLDVLQMNCSTRSTPQIRELQLLYEGESLLGDIVRVDMWEDPDAVNRDAVRGIISKSGKPLIYSLIALHTDEGVVTSHL